MNNQNNISELGKKVCSRIDELASSGQLTNADLVQIIEAAGLYLNLCTRSAYAKESGISYNGAKKHRQNITLFGVKFIINNL